MERTKASCIALIPARIGSKRVKSKNIFLLDKHPLIAYTIAAAIKSGVFSKIIVSTNSKKIQKIATYYGAEVPFLRPQKYASDNSPDIEWIRFMLRKLQQSGESYDCFCILRPTSPFRTVQMIQRAWKEFTKDGKADSLRAVEKCKQHPAKMWKIKRDRMYPLLKTPKKYKTPWHSTPYQALPEVYAQNASLEFAWWKIPMEKHTISGNVIMPFFTEGYEGYDINDEKDFVYAEHLIKMEKAKLPGIKKPSYKAGTGL